MWYVVEWYTRGIVAPDIAGSSPVVSPNKIFSEVKEKILVRVLLCHSLYGGESDEKMGKIFRFRTTRNRSNK